MYPGWMANSVHPDQMLHSFISLHTSGKHAYIILTPLKPHFYIAKLGFTGVYIIFLILLKNTDCGYSLELPRWGSSNKYPQSMFWAEIWKILEFLFENFPFLAVKFSIYLNRRVFVMRPVCSNIQGYYCILEESNFNFRYVGLYAFGYSRGKWLSYFQTMEILIKCHILRHLIWVCRVF